MPILKPTQNWSIIPAVQPGQAAAQRVLLIGQKTSAGTASGLVQNIENDNSWYTKFGAKSQLAQMCNEFRKLNEVTTLDCLVLSDNPSGSAATSSFAVSGTATENGTLYFTVGSEKNYRYTVDVLSGDTADDIGIDLAGQITADTYAPFSAANVSGTVTNTAANKGTLANDWSIKVEGEVAGISVVLTAWTGGASDPTLTSILDPIANIRYQSIVWPNSHMNEGDLVDLLNARFNIDYKIMDGVGFVTKVGTATECVNYADQNSQSFVVFGNKSVNRTTLKGSAIVEIPHVITTQFVAFRALRYTPDTIITRYQNTTASSDQFGGQHQRSLPYFNSLMPLLPVAEEIDEFTLVEMNETLEGSGVSVISSNRSYNGVILGAVVTTYLTNNAGNSDTSYKFLNTIDTESYIREYFYESFRSQKGQNRLTAGSVADGFSVDNEGTLRAFCLGLFQDLGAIQICQAGKAAEKDYKQYLTVTLDLTSGKVTIAQSPLLVSQLRAVIGTIQVAFSR